MSFGFCILYEMALGLRNGFPDPLGFHTMCEMGLNVRNFLHGLRKFCTVIEMISQGLAYFPWVCEFGSQGVRNFAPHAK